MADKIRFYTDEQVAKAVVRGLRQRGVDVLTATEAGLLGASDDVHLERAGREGRVLFTHDTDFLALAVSTPDHSGIVYVHQQTSIGSIIAGLLLIFHVMEPSDMVGHVEYL
jgi:predicted nuclease of predicted toxin-antitoxin system